jgi:hypothetical protein
MSEYKTTYHGKLKLHLERHIYKRGQYKGDAPMEARQRSKNHYRVIDRGTHMAVRFHNTDIIKAYPDGKITIDCEGWADRITTKTHLNMALPGAYYVASYKVHSHSQLVVRTQTGRYRYYDGITFDADGTPTTELKPFLARRIDKDQVAVGSSQTRGHAHQQRMAMGKQRSPVLTARCTCTSVAQHGGALCV